MNNGYNYLCNSFNDSSEDFIVNLNAPPAGAPPGSTTGEAPGSRPEGAPPNPGVLYVAIYAADNGDFVGGSVVSDCMGRVLARNLAADAVNIDTIQVPVEPPSDSIPDFFDLFITPDMEDKFARHQNTVHHREVIFRALYSVVHHQTPPRNIAIQGDSPVVPPPQTGPAQAAVVLLMDTSGSMGWGHEGVPGVEESSGRIVGDLVRLYDDGTHGDATAGDGTCTGSCPDASVPGTYAFEFNASGRTAAGIPFERNQRIEKHVPVKAERVAAEAVRLAGDAGKRDLYEVSVRPADSLGNLFGPGHAHKILWEAGQGKFTDPVLDRLDGRYSRTLDLPPGTDPAAVGLTFVVADSQFRLNLRDALGGTGHTLTCWLLVLLILVLATMVWIIRN